MGFGACLRGPHSHHNQEVEMEHLLGGLCTCTMVGAAMLLFGTLIAFAAGTGGKR